MGGAVFPPCGLAWGQTMVGVMKAVCCHPAYLIYAECIMWNARLDEAQAGIKIGQRYISNLRHADDITLMAESEEELSSRASWWKWKSRVKKLA